MNNVNDLFSTHTSSTLQNRAVQLDMQNRIMKFSRPIYFDQSFVHWKLTNVVLVLLGWV